MIGVILWSDATDHKAVIWCEDQGDLAFLSGPDTVVLPDPFYTVGEVVEFDIRTERNLRVARNLNRLAQSSGTAVVDGLHALTGKVTPDTSETATVVPFRADPARPSIGRPIPRQLRRG